MMSKYILPVLFCLNINIVSYAYAAKTYTAKNKTSVILLLADGTSVSHYALARWYNGGKPFPLDAHTSGLIRTYCADSTITDSAPGATAYASGYKSNTKFVGIMPERWGMPNVAPVTNPRQPIATVLEAAMLAGKSAGLVSTSQIQHATPAAFSAHYFDRDDYLTIAKQQVFLAPDVMLGGGLAFLKPSEPGDTQENLIDTLTKQNYAMLYNHNDLIKYKPKANEKVWGAFAPLDVPYDFDRNPELTPSLAEMTQAALAKLSLNPQGFFLMVEGSKIDWASHLNDPVGVISEVLAYEQAAAVALDFAKSHPNTIVIGVEDHGNGGLSIGNYELRKGYDKAPLAMFIDPLKKAKHTTSPLYTNIMANSNSNTQANMIAEISKNYGISDLSATELKQLQEAFEKSEDKFRITLGNIMSARAYLGWTTIGHTGDDVPLFCYRQRGQCLGGLVENTDVNKFIEKELNLNLESTTKKLFINAHTAFAKNIKVSIDKTNKTIPLLTLENSDIKLSFPANQNTFTYKTNTTNFNGITIIQNNEAWLSQDAINQANKLLIKK